MKENCLLRFFFFGGGWICSIPVVFLFSLLIVIMRYRAGILIWYLFVFYLFSSRFNSFFLFFFCGFFLLLLYFSFPLPLLLCVIRLIY